MSQSDILIVDDNPANLKLLEDMLRQRGHEVRSFPLGRLALAAAKKSPPDLILLDVNMPEMNGYEVCALLKSTPQLSDIPVMFLSALNETQDKVNAFQSGGVDFISKPFQFEEVHARVETHLKLQRFQRELKQRNQHLERAVALRTRELAEANERLRILDRSKDEFLKLISHELRTPLNGLLGVSELLLEGTSSAEESIEFRELFGQSRRRILALLDDALLLTQIDVNAETFRPVAVSLHKVLTLATERTAEFARSMGVEMSAPPADIKLVMGAEDLLVRAFHALLETAVKFSKAGESVRVGYELASDSLRVNIQSHGKTIPDALVPKFFDLFAISESSTPGRDLGLGPAVAYRILSLFDASVVVENQTQSGIQLMVSLKPVQRSNA